MLEIAGQWNLPSAGKTLNGTLYINPTEGSINLITYSSISVGLYNEFDTITGITSHGFDLTLYKCQVVREVIHGGAKEQYETQIIADYVFVGIAFESRDKILFHEIKFRFSNLDEWAYLKGFDLSPIENCIFALRYKFPKEIECKLDDETSINISCELHGPSVRVVEKEIKVTQKVYVSVKHKIPKPFDYSLNLMKTFMGLVSVNIGRSVRLIEVTGFNSEHFQTYDNGKKIYRKIDIRSTEMTDENYTAVDPRVGLLNLKDIKDNFDLYVKEWFKKSNSLQPVIDLYLNTLNYREMSIELHFLSLVQALESYHRRRRKNSDLKRTEHKLRIKSILESVPTKYEDWLESKLAFSYEPTLQDRLKDLIHDNNDYWIFLNGKAKGEKFVTDVKYTRNYYTHYDESLRNKALKGKELEFACSHLQLMVEYYLLKEIGLSYEFLRQRFVKRTKHLRDIEDTLKTKEAKRH